MKINLGYYEISDQAFTLLLAIDSAGSWGTTLTDGEWVTLKDSRLVEPAVPGRVKLSAFGKLLLECPRTKHETPPGLIPAMFNIQVVGPDWQQTYQQAIDLPAPPTDILYTVRGWLLSKPERISYVDDDKRYYVDFKVFTHDTREGFDKRCPWGQS